MNKCTKKKLLNKTGVEYGDYTINHVLGCSHGCTYPCYAYMIFHRFGKANNMEDWCDYKIYDNVIDTLKKELVHKQKKIKTVHLSFSTDPFMYKKNEVCKLSIDIIKEINKYGIPCYVLTKGILPKELVELDRINYYGITYVSNEEEFREKYEKNSAPLEDRLASLKFLSENGCNTWVSIEPYPTPNILEQDLMEILNKIKFVNSIVFGRLNYNSEVKKYKNYQLFYNTCAECVIAFCHNNNIECHIKKNTYKEL